MVAETPDQISCKLKFSNMVIKSTEQLNINSALTYRLCLFYYVICNLTAFDILKRLAHSGDKGWFWWSFIIFGIFHFIYNYFSLQSYINIFICDSKLLFFWFTIYANLNF